MKNQESMIHKEKKNKSIETDQETLQIIELLNKKLKLLFIFQYVFKRGGQ